MFILSQLTCVIQRQVSDLATMSLLKSAMAARINKLPNLPPMAPPPPPTTYPTTSLHESQDDEDNDDEEAEARDGLGSLSLQPPRVRNASKSASSPNPLLSPLSASTHFDQAIQVSVPASDLDFRVYITPQKPSDDGEVGSLMVCHHGAGYSALSFACLAKEVSTTNGECGFMAFDARAHG